MQYDRIDPAEMQQLKDEIAQLQAQNAEFKEAAEKQSQETAAQLARVCETFAIGLIVVAKRFHSLHNLKSSTINWKKPTIS